ncbi:MAG TPA: Swt1 family HEPN domain-containing protein [Planctomycetota bacterium]|nr:Swt1 family HEPN domain-containing protein [Planctomycetota bacterium]
MAITNHERISKAMELLRDGLRPFIERELKARLKDSWDEEVKAALRDARLRVETGVSLQDVSVQLVVMDRCWGSVFRWILGKAERSLVHEIKETRNKWAHQEPFSSDDTDRALDSITRLLTAVSAKEADDVARMKLELRRLTYDEQVRSEKRKVGGSLIESAVTGGLKPWREVVTPHADVASGRYQNAEFAADLWQVHIGEGSDEYSKPAEFFRRTFLTESLKKLLVGGVRRISGKGGDPVIQLQTNFGGGKTHSMLALYHLFSGASPSDLAGVDEVLAAADQKSLPKAKRVVLVGNKLSPGNPSVKADGTVVRTIWGELAYQLGGKKAFERIRADDENATNPGDRLRELFKEYGPCLILIDEWVAYARQLHDQSDLPAGGFETQFTFAQALTESAKLVSNCLLVISLPASDTSGSPHTQADDAEVGGIRGREALERLRNVVGRVESSWRPATAEEGFEIVRRRLFEPLDGPGAFKDRDVVAAAFSDMYHNQSSEFPVHCKSSEYRERIKSAYPIHPEIFDRLYTDWSTLLKFQRTRGVLRLMATVIHALWEKGDRNPLILPSTIPIDDPRVQAELVRYLSDNWAPIIEKDVDGANSVPLKIDAEHSNLGKLHATRRVARTIYLGSAPTASAAQRGLEDRRIKLGCAMPGESPAVFGDALRRLAAAATYLYQDGARFWYGTQPTVSKLADDRAEELKRDPDAVIKELSARVRNDVRKAGEFVAVHPLPQVPQDVADDIGTRLIVLAPEHFAGKDAGSPAEKFARSMLEMRGNTPRIFRNSLVFLAADKTRFQDYDEAVRRYLAWKSILDEKDVLNLDPFQVRQAESRLKTANDVVDSRLSETYQWLLVPVQKAADAPTQLETIRLSGSDALAVRASRKLQSEEALIVSFASSRLRMELDKIPLWRGSHVSVRQLVEDFAKYPYLPRLKSERVILDSINQGLTSATWASEGFAYADSYDEAANRYRGLRLPPFGGGGVNESGLLVKPEVALAQAEAELPRATPSAPLTSEGSGDFASSGDPASVPSGHPQTTAATAHPKTRFHGSVSLDPERVVRDASQVASEIIAHLVELMSAKVRVTLEIEADIPGGASDHVIRVVSENSRSLKFTSHGFESD